MDRPAPFPEWVEPMAATLTRELVFAGRVGTGFDGRLLPALRHARLLGLNADRPARDVTCQT